MLELLGAIVAIAIVAALIVSGVAVGTLIAVGLVVIIIGAVLSLLFGLAGVVLKIAWMICVGLLIQFLAKKGLDMLEDKAGVGFLEEVKTRELLATGTAIAGTIYIFF